MAACPKSSAGINIPGSSRFSGHPKMTMDPFCTRDSYGPGGIERHNRFRRLKRHSEEHRKNLKYLMHLATPLILAMYAIIRRLRCTRDPRRHLSTSMVHRGSENIRRYQLLPFAPRTSTVPVVSGGTIGSIDSVDTPKSSEKTSGSSCTWRHL
jgi:hypothetical protein